MRKSELAEFPLIPRAAQVPKIRRGLPDHTARWQMIYVFETLVDPLARRQILALDGLSSDLMALEIDPCAVSSEPEKSMRNHAQVLGLELPLGFGLQDEERRRYGLSGTTQPAQNGAQVLIFDPAGRHYLPDFTDVSPNDLEIAVLAFALRDIRFHQDSRQTQRRAIPI